jgi:hypothetical protein
MTFYPDRRSKFAGIAQWDIASGTPRADNPAPTPETKTMLARRTEDNYEQDEKGKWILKPGSHQPRRDFRTTTATSAPPGPIQAVPAAPIQANDAKVPETPKSASPTAPAPTNIGSVLAGE